MFKTTVLLAFLVASCGDSALSSEMVSCSVNILGAGAVTKCSSICAQYDSRLAMPSAQCSVARFAGSNVNSSCGAFAIWLTDEDGEDHYGCCAASWDGSEDFYPNANIPAGETHFLECDRSEWPKR